jgi:hypothetical protein
VRTFGPSDGSKVGADARSCVIPFSYLSPLSMLGHIASGRENFPVLEDAFAR